MARGRKNTSGYVPGVKGGTSGSVRKTGGHRKHKENVPVPIPYAPTKKGRRAAKEAGELDRIGETPPIATFRAPTEETGGVTDLAGTLASIAASPVGAALPGDSNPVLDYLKKFPERTQEHATDQIPGLPDEGALGAALTTAQLETGGEASTLPSAAETVTKAVRSSTKVAEEAGAGRVARALAGGKGPVRSAVGRAAAKAEPEIVKGARQGVARRAAAQAEKLPAPVQTAGKVAGKAVALPFKRPLTTPIAAQAPAFVLSGGDIGELGKPFEGRGTLASITGAIGGAGTEALPGVAGNAFNDLLNLPSVALPSIYLPAAGAVESAQGDSSRFEKLWDEYLKTGVIPALLRADPAGALKAAKEHPLFTALEASGGIAALGRGSGALARGVSGGKIGSTERPGVVIKGAEHYGNVNEILGRGRYSPDLIRQGLQRGYDRRRREKTGGPYATKKQADRIVSRDLPDRYAFEREQVRRLNREKIVKEMQAAEPRKGRFKVDKASADVVSLAVQRIIRSPETFYEDLDTYRSQLKAAGETGELTRNELSANRKLIHQIDRAIESANPEEVVKAANVFIEHHGELTKNIVDQGLLDPEQARMSAAMPFARVHMGASHDGERTVDADGNPLSADAIEAEMRRHGVEPAGYLTHQPRTASARGAWYRAFFPERQSLSKKHRTGAAAAHGTYDASYRALVEQAARSQSIVDATGGFDGLLRNYKITPPKGVTDLTTAYDALEHPDRYPDWQVPPDIKLRPVRTAPFLSLKRELRAAARHQDLMDPEAGKELYGLAQKTLQEAEEPGAGPVTYVPELLYERLGEHFQSSTKLEKAVQLGNTAFKGAVLPFSPSFYIGNFADNAMRTALAGIGPTDIALGHKIVTGKTILGKDVVIDGKAVEPLAAGARESIQPGALYGSLKRSAPYRDARQFDGSSIAGLARGVDAFFKTPGPKQAKLAFTKSRDVLMELNSRMFERLPQYGAIGKEARRELQATSGKWHHALTVSDGAFNDLVKGLRHTDKQIQYAKAVEQVFGNWGKNGPNARGVLANLVPFWQWGRASTRFVLFTLPAHHPIKTALIAAAAEMTEEERKKFGLDQFAEEPLPGFLQGNIPSGGSVTRNLSKYTSFGVFGDYPDFIGRMFFAQGSSPQKALEGIDWKNDQLSKADGSPMNESERAKVAILTAGEQFIPGINLIQSAIGGELEDFNPVVTEDKAKLDFLRSLSKSQQITVPVKGSGSSSSSGGVDYNSVFNGGSGSVDYGAVFSGGN